MRSAVLLLGAFGLASARQDPAAPSVDARSDAGERAFVELSAAREDYYLHERIHLHLRFGVEQDFLDHGLLQLFQQPLEVPVQVQASWLQDLPCTSDSRDEAPPDGDERSRLSFALDEQVAAGARVEDRLQGARRFVVLQVEKSFLPTCSGELAIPAPLLRLAYADDSREDIFGGRGSADRREALVHGRPLTLRILALPEEGRPLDFGGAVGSFSVGAEADPRELAAGESFKLSLSILGQGNLGFFDPPRLERLDGFHLRGRVEDLRGSELTVTYDLAPLAETVKEVPSIPFVFFDPAPPAGYRRVQTSPIPLRVLPALEGERDPAPRTSWAIYLAAGLTALGLALWRWSRTRRESAGGPARDWAAEVLERARRPGSDPSQAFAEFLAERLRCPVPAVIGPDLERRLVAAGVPAELARRAGALLERLMAARYGGTAPPAGEELRELVDSLDASFRRGLAG